MRVSLVKSCSNFRQTLSIWLPTHHLGWIDQLPPSIAQFGTNEEGSLCNYFCVFWILVTGVITVYPNSETPHFRSFKAHFRPVSLLVLGNMIVFFAFFVFITSSSWPAFRFFYSCERKCRIYRLATMPIWHRRCHNIFYTHSFLWCSCHQSVRFYYLPLYSAQLLLCFRFQMMNLYWILCIICYLGLQMVKFTVCPTFM